jgi:hypothetical protein
MKTEPSAGATRALEEIELMRWPLKFGPTENERILEIIDRETGAKKLSDALKDVMVWIDNWSPPFIYDSEWSATEDAVRNALSLYKKD